MFKEQAQEAKPFRFGAPDGLDRKLLLSTIMSRKPFGFRYFDSLDLDYLCHRHFDDKPI